MADHRPIDEINAWLANADVGRLSDILEQAVDRLAIDQQASEVELESAVDNIGQSVEVAWQSLEELQASLDMIDSQSSQTRAANCVSKESFDLILQIEAVSSTQAKLESIERHLERTESLRRTNWLAERYRGSQSSINDSRLEGDSWLKKRRNRYGSETTCRSSSEPVRS